jgi:YesN/AraC family two-component response regulator
MNITARPLPALSLLIVEDEAVTRRLYCGLIARKFPDIVIYDAASGTLAVELSKEHAPDIVITDINMPGMDGIEMAEQIKAMKVTTRFVVLTGHSDKTYLNRCLDIGVKDYFLKPIDFKKVVAAIGKCIDEIGRERRSAAPEVGISG